jgi:sulfatase maturation enzyme AslB (radical SAM superfamily)
MWCSVLEHYVVVNHEGKFKACTAILEQSPSDRFVFDTFDELNSSEWLTKVKQQMQNNIWPNECFACREKESNGVKSLRQHHNDKHLENVLINENYLKVEIATDNICNSACQFCYPGASTKIGSLTDKNYLRINNMPKFIQVPQDRIIQVDIVGGEPSYSPVAKEFIKNLPPTVKSLRFTTNGSRVMTELIPLLEQGIKIKVIVSFDGVGLVYEYVRWPVKYSIVKDTIVQYRELTKRYPNLTLSTFTTICSLNVVNVDEIFLVTDDIGLSPDLTVFNFLVWPKELDARFKNLATLTAIEKFKNSSDARLVRISNMIAVNVDNQEEFDNYVTTQDTLRSINIKNYLGELYGKSI